MAQERVPQARDQCYWQCMSDICRNKPVCGESQRIERKQHHNAERPRAHDQGAVRGRDRNKVCAAGADCFFGLSDTGGAAEEFPAGLREAGA